MKTLLLILFLASSPLFCQDYYYNYFTEKDGLSSNNVYKVIQDQKGYLWFATDSGVSRYDGNTFEEFSTEDGLTDYEILSLYEDSKGRIWFETFNGKPCFYLNGEIHNPDNNNLLSQVKFRRYIKNTFEDSKGNIWLGATENSCKIDFKNNRVTHYNERSVFFIENEKKEVLIYSGSNYYFNATSGKREFTTSTNLYQKTSSIQSHLILNNENLLYSNANKLYYKEANENKISDLNSFNLLNDKERIISIYQNSEHQVYISSSNGVITFNANNIHTINRHHERFLKGRNVTSVVTDHQNNLWITTTNGVYYLNNYKQKRIGQLNTNSIDFSSNKSQILSISADNKASIFDKDNFNLLHEFNTDIKPKKIVKNGEVFFVITNNGTYKIQNAKHQETFKYLSLKDLVVSKGYYYLADANGVYKVLNHFDKKESFRFSNALKTNSIKQLINNRAYYLKNCDSVIFASTNKGLFKIKNDRVEEFIPDNEAYIHRIYNIDFYLGHVVLGTEGNGLYIYKNNVLAEHFNVKNGLLTNQIKNTFVYNDTLYIATKKGVQYLTQNLELKNTKAFVSNSIINQAGTIDNKIVLATSEGLIFSDLNKKASTYSIKSEIVASIDDETISNNESLSFTRSPIDFRFKIFNYSYEIFDFEYRLVGADKTWNTSQSSSVSYQNLSPGIYTFQIKSNNTIINEFAFSIKSPFWLKWWFLILAGLAILWLGYLIYKLLLNRKLQKAKKEHEIHLMLAKAEQDALKAQMNPHFIFNALNAIQNLILQSNTENAYAYLGDFSNLVRTILNNSRTLSTTISKEIKFLKLYLKLEDLRFSNKFNYNINADSVTDLEQHIPSMLIQPFVENSIIHGLLPLKDKTKAKLSITFKEDEDFIYCTMEDNGIGRKASKTNKKGSEKSLGLKITQERLQLYDEDGLSNFTIFDKEIGTQVVLSIRKNVRRTHS